MNLFCRATGSIQGWSFFFGLFLYLLHKPKHLFKNKRAVKAAKSNRLSSHWVEIHLRKICSNTCKDAASHRTNKAQIDQFKNSYGTMLFMLKQVSLPKQKSIENRPKTNIRPFCKKAFNYYLLAPYLNKMAPKTSLQGPL